jgi:hypothetical protein
MARKPKEFVTLPEAIEQALPIPPDEARKIISAALSAGTLREEPWTVIGASEIARGIAGKYIDHIPEHSIMLDRWVPDAWIARLQRGEVNWDTGEVLILKSSIGNRMLTPQFARKEIDTLFAGLRATRKGIAQPNASQRDISKFLLSTADGNKTQAQLKSEVEVHFGGSGRIVPRELFREALKRLPVGSKLKRGKKPSKSK